MPKQTLALIAHDAKKQDMVTCCQAFKDSLALFDLVGTGTTGYLINRETGLSVYRYLSGPEGGDAQIAARVAEGTIRAVFFFIDPCSAHAHAADIQSLMRVCNVHNVPLAINPASAGLMIEQLRREIEAPAEVFPGR